MISLLFKAVVLFCLFRNLRAHRWFDPAQSSIQPWLDFDGTNLPHVGGCQLVVAANDTDPAATLKNASCIEVCSSTTSLQSLFPIRAHGAVDPNLANCGIWATMAAAYYKTPLQLLSEADSVNWAGFADSTLNFSVSQETRMPMLQITEILQSLYMTFHGLWLSDDSAIPLACITRLLFMTPLEDPTEAIQVSLRNLRACLEQMCSPPTLDPDLAGIGVRCVRNIINKLSLNFTGTFIFRNSVRDCYHGIRGSAGPPAPVFRGEVEGTYRHAHDSSCRLPQESVFLRKHDSNYGVSFD